MTFAETPRLSWQLENKNFPKVYLMTQNQPVHTPKVGRFLFLTYELTQPELNHHSIPIANWIGNKHEYQLNVLIGLFLNMMTMG